MKPKASIKTNRQYFIDWLRIILIFSVFLYHIGMYFNPWNWHVKNNVTVTWFSDIMWFLHLWRMPLLFLVSGVGTYYALGHRTVKKYLKERFIRLYIPFIVGLFTLVPIQVYIEKSNQYSSLSQFYPHMFNGIYPIGNFSWHHLWFIIYLFIISLIISPFLNYLRSNKFRAKQQNIITFLSKPLALNWVALALIVSQAILRQYFPDQTNALYNDWAYFVYYLLFFLAGFMLITDKGLMLVIAKQRRLYLLQTIIATGFLFSISSLFTHKILIDWLNGITGVVIGWSCSIAALGYAKEYLNKDTKWRGLLNEGIYPFYLLHQPIIVVLGYSIKPLVMPVIIKIIILTLVSFILSVGIYLLLLRHFNIFRLVFGLKLKNKKKRIILKKYVVNT